MFRTITMLGIGLLWLTAAQALFQISSELEEYIGDYPEPIEANMTIVEVSVYWIDVQYNVDESIKFSFVRWSHDSDGKDVLCPPSVLQHNKQETFTCRVDGLKMCSSYALEYFGIPEDVDASDSFHSWIPNVLTLPDETIPPANLTCNASLPGTLMLSWDNPCPEECQASFEVYWEGQAPWDASQFDTNSSTTEAVSYTLDQTIPGTDYSIDVTLAFQGNSSGETASITCSTLPEQSSPPTLTVSNTGTTFLYLTWEAPATANGVIESYEIKLTDENGSIFNKTIDVVYDFNLTENVFACSAYQVALAAVNGAGLGLWDTQPAETDQANIRDIVIEDVSNSSVVISWTPAPVNCDRNGTILSWQGESLWDEYYTEDFKLLEGGISTFTLTGLYPYTLYKICLTLNADWAEQICTNTTTRQGVPAAPEYVETSSTKSTITLSWNETGDWYGVPSKYLITCPTAQITDEVDSNTTEHTISDLYEDTDYSVSVQACNEEECSAATQSMVRTTGDVPIPNPKSNTGLIVGLTLGSVAVVAIIAAFFVIRARRMRRTQDEEETVFAASIVDIFDDLEKNNSLSDTDEENEEKAKEAEETGSNKSEASKRDI